jgi:hypothetical protein
MEAPRKSKKKSSSKSKKSGVRTKFLIESLRNDYYELRSENDRLRELVKANLDERAASAILAECFDAQAPRAKVDDIDGLAAKMAGADVDDEDL